MMGHLWFFMAFGAAILWGLSYVFVEKFLKAGVSISVFFVVGSFLKLIIFSSFVVTQGIWTKNMTLLRDENLWPFLLGAVIVDALAIYLIYQAVILKNAAYVSIIEMSYPFFTIIFSVYLLKSFEMSAAAFTGGLLILSGVVLIYLKG